MRAQLPSGIAQAVGAHLDRCPACRADVAGLRRLRASVRAAVLGARDLSPRPDFAAACAARLRHDAARAATAGHRRRTWLAVAAAVVLVVGGGFGLFGEGVYGFSALAATAVGDHRFCVVAIRPNRRPFPLDDAARAYDDPVARSLASAEPKPATLGGGPVRVLERHSCVFENRRFAHLVLEYRQSLISLVVTQDERLLRALPGASAPADGSVVTLAPRDGFHVAAFRGPRHLVFLISTLGDADLRDVARSMAPSVARAMRGL